MAELKKTANSEILIETLQEIVQKNPAQVWDVRSTDEFSYEHIKNTRNVPMELLSAASQDTFKSETIYVLCQSGLRSTQAVAQMRALGLNAICVQGGITAWKKKGFAIERGRTALPIMRQVQIVAGSLALIGGLFVSLRWVAIFVGAGLIFAGVSGTCGMALLLNKMPWNKTVKKEICSPENTCTPSK